MGKRNYRINESIDFYSYVEYNKTNFYIIEELRSQFKSLLSDYHYDLIFYKNELIE